MISFKAEFNFSDLIKGEGVEVTSHLLGVKSSFLLLAMNEFFDELLWLGSYTKL